MKYKIIYTSEQETEEMELLALLDKWTLTDGLGGCRYYRDGQQITIKELSEDLNVAIAERAGEKHDGRNERIADSGYYAQVASSGYSAKVASSGYSAKVASSGDSAQVASSGYSAQVASSGYYAQVASSGYYAQVASSGYSAKVASSGYSAKVASSGYSAQVASSGDSAQVASSGDSAQVASSGYSAKVASSGYSAQHDIKGKESVCFDCGVGGIIKGIKGTYIALCEWYRDGDNWKIRGTKAGIIDGKELKENTYYGLYNGEFKEIDLTDDVRSAVVETKGKVKKVRIIDTDKNVITEKTSYIVSDNNGNFAHGATIKEAKKSLIYKISNRDTSQYKGLTLESELTFEEAIKMYRVITGACEFGTRNFVEQNKIEDRKYKIKEIIKLTAGQYGNDVLRKFFGEQQ